MVCLVLVLDLDDGCFVIVEFYVLYCVLLVVYVGIGSVVVESEIGYYVFVIFFDKQINVDDVGCGWYVEYDVLQIGCLRGRLVYVCCCFFWGDGSGVDDKVVDLVEEDIDCFLVENFGVVWVVVDQFEFLEVGCGFEGRWSGSIFDKMGEVCWQD